MDLKKWLILIILRRRTKPQGFPHQEVIWNSAQKFSEIP